MPGLSTNLLDMLLTVWTNMDFLKKNIPKGATQLFYKTFFSHSTPKNSKYFEQFACCLVIILNHYQDKYSRVINLLFGSFYFLPDLVICKMSCQPCPCVLQCNIFVKKTLKMMIYRMLLTTTNWLPISLSRLLCKFLRQFSVIRHD